MFGCAGGGPGEHGAGGGFGIDRVGLAEPVSGGPVGAVDLDDVRAAVVQVAGESGAVRTCAFETEASVWSEIRGPAVQLLVARCCGGDGEFTLSALPV